MDARILKLHQGQKAGGIGISQKDVLPGCFPHCWNLLLPDYSLDCVVHCVYWIGKEFRSCNGLLNRLNLQYNDRPHHRPALYDRQLD